MRPVLLLAAALAAVPGLAAAAAPPPALLRQVVDAYGGRAALARARVVRQEGTVTSTRRGGVAGRMVRILERPGSLRVEIAYPGEPPEVRVVHRGRGDRDGVDVAGPPLDAMVLQAARLSIPSVLVEDGARLEDRGEVVRGERRLRAVALRISEALELVVEIDPATHRVVRSTGSMPGPAGRMEFVTEYSRFERTGGVLFARHEETFVGAQRSGATDLTRIELLPRVPEGTFDERL